MNVVISQPMYFPWVGLFEQIKLADVYVHYTDVQFSKGSFVNRVQVKTDQGSTWMTVPLKQVSINQTIDAVQINNAVDWRRKHRRLLQQAYARAPYRDEMLELVDGVFSAEYETIGELSRSSIDLVCRYFGLDSRRQLVDIASLNIPGRSSQRVLDTVLALDGDTYITGLGASKYLDHEQFDNAGVRVEYMNYRMTPYAQLHGDFTPYVTVLDLIANAGKEGQQYIASGTTYWKEHISNE
jgi:hypothetical protein